MPQREVRPRLGTGLATFTQQFVATASPKMRYWNIAPQRYCRRLARYWRALRLSADRATGAPGHTRGKGRRLGAASPTAPGFTAETDSPLEGGGFEPSVPLAEELLFLERKCRKRRASRRQIVGLPIVLGRSSACPAQIRLPSRFEATRRGLRTSGFRATDRAADNRNLIVGSSSKIAVAR